MLLLVGLLLMSEEVVHDELVAAMELEEADDAVADERKGAEEAT